jgi:hypothetical protein
MGRRADVPVKLVGHSSPVKAETEHMSFGKRTPVGHPGPERRSAPRRELKLPGEILLPSGPSRECQLLDVSKTGARLGIDSVLGVPSSFELRVAGQTLRATVVRKTPGRLYVKFG